MILLQQKDPTIYRILRISNPAKETINTWIIGNPVLSDSQCSWVIGKRVTSTGANVICRRVVGGKMFDLFCLPRKQSYTVLHKMIDKIFNYIAWFLSERNQQISSGIPNIHKRY